VRTVLRVLNVSISLAVLGLGSGVTVLAGAQLTVFSFAFLLSLYLVRERVAKPVFHLSWPSYRGLLKAALPFALCMGFITIYQRTATILLSFFKGDEVTGWYSGAGTFGRLFDFIPMSLQGALLPVMAQFAQKPGKTWQSAYRHSMKYLLVVGLPIATGLAIRSRQFVHLLLGEQYEQSAGILSVLIWALVFSFMNHGASNALISLDGEKTYLKIVGFAAACNVAINFVLVPILGPYGAAIAQLLTECLVLGGQFRALTVVGRRIALWQIAAKPLISAAVLALVLFAAGEAGLLLAVPLSAAAYVGSLFLLQTFERDEILLMADFAQSLISRLRFQRSRS